MRKKQGMGIIISTILMVIAIVLIGPLDIFTHGFFCDEIDCSQIAAEDFKDTISLASGDYEMVFSPRKPHMAGFEIYLTNQPEGNSGELVLTITDGEGDIIDHIDVDLRKIHAESWYQVYLSANLREGKEYTLKFSAKDCTETPCLQCVDASYLPDETITGNVLVLYAYAGQTFTFQNKIIFVLFMAAAWGLICAYFTEGKKKLYISWTSIGIIMTAMLTWNYMYNSMDNHNTVFNKFEVNSETFVTGMIYAEQNGVYFGSNDGKNFGLGRYYDLKGGLSSYDLEYITNEEWLNGYSRSQAAIIVNSNIYSKTVAVVGNYIAFHNNEVFQIVDIEDDGKNIIIHLDTEKVLSYAKHGSLDDVIFYDQENQQMDKGLLESYRSQFGLQGKAFRHLARYLEITDLNLLCCIAAAGIFVIITMLVAVKYDRLLAGCFFITFWLSPWIVNFARNLYWVECTWFIPMVAGLFCAWKIDSRKCRIISYIGAFLSIFVKSLCGYEYISVIMMGLIAFPLVDSILALIKKDKKKVTLFLKAIFVMSVAAMAGFIAAICIHALLRSNGNVMEGIKNIIEQDVCRRTSASDLNEMDPIFWPSLNSSVWETFCKYFHFNTEIITGIAGNLFPLLCIVPLCIFCNEYKKKKLNIKIFVMYIIFFLTSISWFCLAKGHSYIHTHLNYVLWYFGFVQICFYTIIHKIMEFFHGISLQTQGDEAQ